MHGFESSSLERWKQAQIAEEQFFRRGRYDVSAYRQMKRQSLFGEFPISSDFFRGKYILEVGCSPLGAIHYLDGAGVKVGVDPLAYAMKDLYEKWATQYIAGIGEFLPFKNEKFDVVICINVLDHVVAPVSVLNEIARVTEQGGTLLLMAHTFHLPQKARSLLTRFDTSHPHHFASHEVQSIVREAGFNIEWYKIKPVPLARSASLARSRSWQSSLRWLIAVSLLQVQESRYLCSKAPREEMVDGEGVKQA